MKISALGVAALILFFLGPARSAHHPAEPAQDAASVRKLIETAEARFARAELRGDLDAMREMYSDAVLGKEAVATRIARFRSSTASLVSERFEISSLEVCGNLAVESGEIVTQLETPARSPSTDRVRYLFVWKRQPDESWKVAQGLWSPSTFAAAPQPARSSEPRTTAALAPPASAAVSVPSPPADFIAIPDPRPLGEAFVRSVQDRLDSQARKLRAISGRSGQEKKSQVVAKADRELQSIIRDIGWTDIRRFGVPASCNAAYIVSQSADLPLMRATLPLMEKDLKNAEGGERCFADALEAYRALENR